LQTSAGARVRFKRFAKLKVCWLIGARPDHQ
jgi:hypothetical protein